jgi:hypothetical protein
VGAREPRSLRNPDYLAEKLLGDPSQFGVDHPTVRALSLRYDDAMKDIEVVNNVRMMTIRRASSTKHWSVRSRVARPSS